MLNRIVIYDCINLSLEDAINKELEKDKLHPVTWDVINPTLIKILQIAYDLGERDGYGNGYDDGFDRSEYYYDD
jgi:hypothetical protein